MSNTPTSRMVLAITCSLFASACLPTMAADPDRRAPKFEGKTIPDPPDQGRPWTPPASTLPKFLITSTADLFEQGVADPRGCEYRRVEIGAGVIVKTRGFVLPVRADIPGRFVVGWDGLISPALTVGEPLDLDRDVNELVERIRRDRNAASTKPDLAYRPGVNWGFGPSSESIWRSTTGDNSPLKITMLLRLGRADLAEALFAAGTSWKPGPRARDLTDYGISYLSLANDWASSAFLTLANAHARGDDVIALDLARRLSRFRSLVEARADFLGFAKANQQGRAIGDGSGRFFYLDQLDQILADHERRANMPARPTIPKPGGDPSARIAALIRDLDQIDEQQMMSPGMAQPGNSWLVEQLIKEGDPAVGPLLDVLESDQRLTRSITNGRGGMITRYIHPVSEAALAGLIKILQTHEFDNQQFSLRHADANARKTLARSIRDYWERNRAISLVDRWYRTLLDDSAGTDRWLEIASAITSPVDPTRLAIPPAGQPPSPMNGEPLRLGRNPSVTSLMIRRIQEIRRASNPNSIPDIGLSQACQMALALNRWDEKASLPILKNLVTICRERSSANASSQPDQGLSSSIVQFTQIRARLGDLEALDEYAGWIRTITPKMVEYNKIDVFQPLVAYPDRPSLASAARWLFADPMSPWLPLVSTGRESGMMQGGSLIGSNLIVLPDFRAAVLAALADRSPWGTTKKDPRSSVQYEMKDGRTANVGLSSAEFEEYPGDEKIPFRVCDFVAWNLARLEGSPKIQLFWPEARRDEAVAGMRDYLRRYGDRFMMGTPDGRPDYWNSRAIHIRFSALQQPATAKDVADGRAIFTLEGKGEARRVVLTDLPRKARWVTLKDTPVDQIGLDNVRSRGYLTDGYVWQAEELRQGETWERSYGFVGNHVIGQAPASEIEFADDPFRWSNLKGGLDARTEMVEPRPAGFPPGRPILVRLDLRNRLGLDHPGPTEFLRPGADGRPALRRGMELVLMYSPQVSSGSHPFRSQPWDEVKPKRAADFNPGDGTRPLATLESYEAMKLDLRDWFDVSRPGQYRVRVKFTADSGVGEGSSSETYFAIVEE